MADQDIADARIAAHQSKRFRDTSASFAAVSAVGAALLYAMGATSNEVRLEFFGIVGAVKLDAYAALLDGGLITIIFGPVLYIITLSRHARYRRNDNNLSGRAKNKAEVFLSNIFNAYPEATILDFMLFLKAILGLIYILMASAIFGLISAMFIKYSTEGSCFGCVAYNLEAETVYGRPIATDGERLVVYLQNSDIRVFAWDGVEVVRRRPISAEKKDASKARKEAVGPSRDATASPR